MAEVALSLVAIACVVAAYYSPTVDGSFGFGFLAFFAILALSRFSS